MRSLLNSALVVSLLCASSAAQTAQTPSPKSKKIPAQKPGAGREITPQQERAISVLNNLFERTKEFADDKTRVETQAQIADALWEYDQQTARRQFTEAFRSIERIENEERPLPYFETPKTFLRLRLSSLLAKRDADLAEKLINSISESQTKTDQTSPTKKSGERGNLYLKLADELIPTDPQRAANLIPKGFNGGFSIELVSTLKFLGRKEPEVADKLLRRALSEIQPDPDAPMMDLFEIGQYFMADYEESANRSGAGRKDEAPAVPEPIKPVLVEPLLKFAFKAITIESANEQSRMSNGQKQERFVMFDMIDHGIVEWLLPLFEQH